jgi:hypothetical protein
MVVQRIVGVHSTRPVRPQRCSHGDTHAIVMSFTHFTGASTSIAAVFRLLIDLDFEVDIAGIDASDGTNTPSFVSP